MEQALLGVRNVSWERSPLTSHVSRARRLYLDDVSPKVPKELPTEGACHKRCVFENPKARQEGYAHVLLPLARRRHSM